MCLSESESARKVTSGIVKRRVMGGNKRGAFSGTARNMVRPTKRETRYGCLL